MRDQLSGDELLTWTIETFSTFYPKTWTQKYCLPLAHWVPILFSLSFFLFDYYSDLTLAIGYYRQSSYLLGSAEENSTAFKTNNCHDPVMSPMDFKTAFLMSLVFFFIPILFSIPISYKCLIDLVSYDDELEICNYTRLSRYLWELYAWLLSILISPFIVLYAAARLLCATYKHKGATKKAIYREELRKFEYLWGVLRTVEASIESGGQLVLQIWLLSFHIQTMTAMDFFQFVQKTVNGLMFFFSFTRIEADNLEQSLGKVTMSTITLVVGVTSCYMTLKRGAVSITDSAFIAISIILQLTARIFSLIMYFVTVPRKHAIEFLFIASHFIILGIFRTIVELELFSSRRKRKQTWKDIDLGIFIINIFASGLVFVRIKRVGQKGSSFVLHVGYWFLALAENLFLVSMPYLYKNPAGSNPVLDCLEKWVLNAYIFCIVGLSLSSVASYFMYYKCFGHPWIDINGPNFDRKRAKTIKSV